VEVPAMRRQLYRAVIVLLPALVILIEAGYKWRP
jgi:hypothetical protein